MAAIAVIAAARGAVTRAENIRWWEKG
jgi:hypothetical protein